MTGQIGWALMGAVAMASVVATMFFFRFWRQTRDSFFLLFAAAFAIDALARFALVFINTSSETEPVAYLPRLITFGLIAVAIVAKNRPRHERQ